MSSTHVEFVEVRKAFAGREVLSGLNLSVRRREVLTLLGASGAGKSVLLKLLIGLLDVDAGRILLDGEDVSQLAEGQRASVRRQVSMLFQTGALFDSMTVGENVAYPLHVQGELSAREIDRRVRERLEMVGLPDVDGMWPSELSGGMRKRVALARALAGNPEVILYDEPTTGLDPMNTRRIDELILSVRDHFGVTSLVVTHDLASAFLISDRLAMLDEGRVVAALPPQEFASSEIGSVREFLAAMPAGTPGVTG